MSLRVLRGNIFEIHIVSNNITLNMKILEIQIENYKSHSNTMLDNLSSFHSFIGKNNSGKTSVFELLFSLKNYINKR